MNARIWVGVLISAVSLIFLALTVDFVELGRVLASANPWLTLAVVALVPIQMYLRAYRWRLLFPSPNELSMPGVLSALYLGYMVNTVVPLRAGELVRAYLVGETEPVSKGTALATVVVEKVLDLGTMALLLFILPLFLPLPPWAQAAAGLSGLALAVAALGLLAMVLARRAVLRAAERLEARVPLVRRFRGRDLVESFMDGFAFVRQPRLLLAITVWSLVLWSLAALMTYLALLAVGIAQSFAVAVFLMVAVNLGMAVPSAPGYVGVFHSTVVVALAPFGVEATQALAAAIIIHTMVFGCFVVGGLYYLARSGQLGGRGKGLGGLVTQARSASEQADPH
jgi:glycosyltransferase 2 family protein